MPSYDPPPLLHSSNLEQVYVFDSTFVSPLALALFGGSFKLEWETDVDKYVQERAVGRPCATLTSMSAQQ
jgi:hypothetical protein